MEKDNSATQEIQVRTSIKDAAKLFESNSERPLSSENTLSPLYQIRQILRDIELPTTNIVLSFLQILENSGEVDMSLVLGYEWDSLKNAKIETLQYYLKERHESEDQDEYLKNNTHVIGVYNTMQTYIRNNIPCVTYLFDSGLLSFAEPEEGLSIPQSILQKIKSHGYNERTFAPIEAILNSEEAEEAFTRDEKGQPNIRNILHFLINNHEKMDSKIIEAMTIKVNFTNQNIQNFVSIVAKSPTAIQSESKAVLEDVQKLIE